MYGKTTLGGTDRSQHIDVCICTYKRPLLLNRLLQELAVQYTNHQFTYSIVVADNDQLQSAKSVVDEFRAISSIPVKYCVEPRQNIALARNKAVENSIGDFIAFIDDDEFPAERWLLNLFEACNKYRADGALGPVKRHFEEEPPTWLVKGNFYERATYRTGLIIDWSKGRTNNTLVKRRIIPPGSQPFRPEFRTGEDQDFFMRMIKDGHQFVWCNEAEVYETIPRIRWKRTFMMRRAALQGAASVLQPSFGVREIFSSIIAIPTYATALPVAFVLGHHRFMTLLVKLFYHIGVVMAFIGINPVKEPYVTE
jgi:glycosyltransferase involved in cell wall biosynthesis